MYNELTTNSRHIDSVHPINTIDDSYESFQIYYFDNPTYDCTQGQIYCDGDLKTYSEIEGYYYISNCVYTTLENKYKYRELTKFEKDMLKSSIIIRNFSNKLFGCLPKKNGGKYPHVRFYQFNDM